MSLRTRTPLAIIALVSLVASRSDAAAFYTYTAFADLVPEAINAQGMVIGHTTAGGYGTGVVYSGYGPDAGRIITIPGTRDVRGINDLGQVVGVTWSGSSYLASPTPGPGPAGSTTYTTREAVPGYPNGINDFGQIVGQDSNGHAYLRSGDKTTELGAPGGPRSVAVAINAYGQVVGNASFDFRSDAHPFLFDGGRMIDLGTLGGSEGQAVGINAAGQVVGESTTASSAQHAFFYSGGRMLDLGTFGGRFSTANAINASGDVVGYSSTAGGDYHAFIYSDGVIRDLNGLVPLPAGWTIAMAFGINDAGQIVGEAVGPGHNGRGFLLTPAGMAPPAAPVPEPGTLAVFGLAAIGLGVRLASRRRRAA